MLPCKVRRLWDVVRTRQGTWRLKQMPGQQSWGCLWSVECWTPREGRPAALCSTCEDPHRYFDLERKQKILIAFQEHRRAHRYINFIVLKASVLVPLIAAELRQAIRKFFSCNNVTCVWASLPGLWCWRLLSGCWFLRHHHPLINHPGMLRKLIEVIIFLYFSQNRSQNPLQNSEFNNSLVQWKSLSLFHEESLISWLG